MKLPILFFLVIFLSISFISAIPQVVISGNPLTSPKEIFKQGEVTDFKIQCFNNITSEFCGIATVGCNVTIIYPNNSMLINNQPMTNQFSFNNYTLNLQTLGDYPCSAICCTKDICGNNKCDFKVTTTGKEEYNTLPLFLLLGAIILFGFASYLKNEYIGLLSGFLFIISGIYMMIYGLGIFQDTYTRALAFITLGIGLVVCFIAVVEMFYTDLGIMGGGNEDE